MNDKNKITIVGAGYVGMSLSLLLAQKNNVLIYDIDKERIETPHEDHSHEQRLMNDAKEKFLQL